MKSYRIWERAIAKPTSRPMPAPLAASPEYATAHRKSSQSKKEAAMRAKRIKQSITALEQEIAKYKADPDNYSGCLLTAFVLGGK